MIIFNLKFPEGPIWLGQLLKGWKMWEGGGGIVFLSGLVRGENRRDFGRTRVFSH